MSPLVKRLIVSLVYGIGATVATVQVALADGVISGEEWTAIIGALFVAFWGKFSSNTTVIAPTRPDETLSGSKRGSFVKPRG